MALPHEFDLVYDLCQKRGLLLRDWCLGLRDDPSYLWSTGNVIQLCWPCLTSLSDEDDPFLFFPRSIAKGLLERIQVLRPGNQLVVMGVKGSGKSVLVAAVCNQLQQSGRKRIVFLDAEELACTFALALWKGLLMAFYGMRKETEEISQRRQAVQLEQWCYAHVSELIFVVDDFESLEPTEEDTEHQKATKAAAKSHLLRFMNLYVLVRVSSVNSRECIIAERNDKKKLRLLKTKFLIDGPYLPAELETWRAVAGLAEDVKKSLNVEYLTGGMPHLLRYYEEAQGDEHTYRDLVTGPVTDKLWTDFIGKLESKAELEAADRLIMRGEVSAMLVSKVKLTCFYEGPDRRYRLLSAYLETQAWNYLRDRYQQVDDGLVMTSIRDSASMVYRELRVQHLPQNSARVGWNVEGLVIAIMRYSRRFFHGDDDWSSFNRVVEYAHGKEVETCSDLSDRELLQGVLLVPMAFNEQAVDVVFMKIVDKVLCIRAMQITTAKWKTKSRKMSHRVWKTEVAPSFQLRIVVPADAEGKHKVQSVETEYYYIVPESVTEQDIPPDEFEEEREEQVDEARIPIESTGPAFKKFGDVNRMLAHLDESLNLVRPSAASVPKLFKCKQEGCESRGSKEDYCCRRHLLYCECRNVDGVTPCGNKVVADRRCHIHSGITIVEDGPEQVFFKALRSVMVDKTDAELSGMWRPMFEEMTSKAGDDMKEFISHYKRRKEHLRRL